MSALDQAFIKAYAQEPAAPVAEPATLRASLSVQQRPARSRAGAAHNAPPAATQIENLYADGSLYRLEVPQSSDLPPPHYLPPVHQHRTVQRRIPGRHRLAVETPAESSPAPAEPPTRRIPTRGLAEIARRLSHDLPLSPSAELPPEVLVVEDPEPQPAAPLPKVGVPSLASHENEKPVTAASLPLMELSAPGDHIPTLVEVCTPWETINDAVAGSMVILSDEPPLGGLNVRSQIDVALDPILEPGYRPQSEASELNRASEAARQETPPAAQVASANKIHRMDPPRQGIDAPHFAVGRDRSTPPPAPTGQQAKAAVDVVIAPLADLTPEETASLLGAPAATPAPPVESSTAEANADAAAVEPLVPMWEVDRFQWPGVCDRLMKDEQSYFGQAGGKLVAAAKDGLKTLGITGSRRGEGRTTLALCLARCAAQSGLNVALIDADFTRPQLASVMGLEVAYGWQDAAQGKIPLPEAAVRSLADKITVLPLEASSVSWPLSLADKRVSALMRTVSETHDLVIVDLGPMSGASEPLFAADEAPPLDAVIVLRDLRYAMPSETQAIGLRLHEAGIEAIGIAENFVPAEKARV